MKVKAIDRGFHVTIREPNEEFDMPEPVPSWCEPVGQAKDAPAGDPDLGKQPDQTSQTGEGGTQAPAKGVEAYHVGGGRYGVKGEDGERIGDFTGSKDEALVEADRINAGTSDPDLTDQDNNLPDA